VPEAPSNPLTSPFSLTDADGYTWLKGNLHTHSTNSDGREEPQQRVDGYAAQGYDFLCLSDHRKITRIDSVTAPADLVLIEGVELHPTNPFGGQTHHFVGLDVHEDMDAGVMAPQLVIDAVLEQGGQAWLAHPHWSSVNILRDTVPLRGLSGLEVFNTTCRRAGRGESSVHWDDWMSLENKLYPALANDDAHGPAADRHDTYQGWNMVRVKERSVEAIMAALAAGASYSTEGPEIHDIQVRATADSTDEKRTFEATIKCSPARRISAVNDSWGSEYHLHGELFEEATFPVRANARWVRFEIVGPEGLKAWSNPFDLTSL